MDDFPLQLLIFGFANRIVEPFCYGCAGFVLTYRYDRLPAKLVFIGVTIFFFLWMDDIWPAMANYSAGLGMAWENRIVAELFAQNPQVGRAEFSSGERTGLWNLYILSAWDIGSAVIFVPLGFYVGSCITRRKPNELAPTAIRPPLPPGSGSKPPPPPI